MARDRDMAGDPIRCNGRSPTNTIHDSHSRKSTFQSDSSTSRNITFHERQSFLFRCYTAVHRAFQFFYPGFFIFVHSLLRSRLLKGAHGPQNYMHKLYTPEHAGGKLDFTKILRLGLLLLSALAGFLYAAYSGQLPLLLPSCRRRQAPAEEFAVFNPFVSNIQPALVHTSSELDVISVFSKFTTSLFVPEAEADSPRESRESIQKVQQRKWEQQEGELELKVRGPQEGKEQRGLPQEQQNGKKLEERRQLEEEEEDAQTHGEQCPHREQRCGHQKQDGVQDRSGKSHTCADALTKDADCSLDSTILFSFLETVVEKNLRSPCIAKSHLAVTDGFGKDKGRTAGGQQRGGKGTEKFLSFLLDCFFVSAASVVSVSAVTGRAVTTVFSQWNAATSLWLLLLLFHLIPAQDKWPLRTEEKPSAGPSRKLPCKRRSCAVTEKCLNTCVITEDSSLTQVLLNPQQQMRTAQRLAAQVEIQPLPEHQQHQAERWWRVFWKEVKKCRMRCFVVERGEFIELLLQSVELSVVGFFLSFFSAKSVFGCESILQQMEAHFAVLLLVSHLQEYLFYFWFHPEKLSVDRFIFNNNFMYGVAVGLSVLELLLKPYEVAVGATLGHALRHAYPLSHTQHVQRQSETVLSLVHTHGQVLSKQKHLLQLIRVNLILVQLSWVGHVVRAAVSTARRYKRGNTCSGRRCSNECVDSNRNQEDFLLTVGRNRHAPVCGSTIFSPHSDTEGRVAAKSAEATSRLIRGGTSCCYCTWSAARYHWHHVFFQEVEKEKVAAFHRKQRGCWRTSLAVKHEGSKDSACVSVSNSNSNFTERKSENDRDAGMTGSSLPVDLQTFDMFSSSSNRQGELDEEQSDDRSCWELSFILYCWTLGALLSIGGLLLRALAHFTARRSFTHKIACAKLHEHALVTHGVYAFMRHPGYAGTFYWAVGLQLMVSNVSVLLLTLFVMHVFFFHRIAFEERMLEQLFPDGVYAAYRSATPATGVPFLSQKIRRFQEKIPAAANGAAADSNVGTTKPAT